MFVCKGKRLANYLIEHGCPVVSIDNDQKSPGFLVFLFEKNKLLNENLDKWQTDKETYRIS